MCILVHKIITSNPPSDCKNNMFIDIPSGRLTTRNWGEKMKFIVSIIIALISVASIASASEYCVAGLDTGVKGVQISYFVTCGDGEYFYSKSAIFNYKKAAKNLKQEMQDKGYKELVNFDPENNYLLLFQKANAPRLEGDLCLARAASSNATLAKDGFNVLCTDGISLFIKANPLIAEGFWSPTYYADQVGAATLERYMEKMNYSLLQEFVTNNYVDRVYYLFSSAL